MAISEKEIKALILKALPDAKVKIEDVSHDGSHYSAYVESQSFEGKNRVQQHQMVFAALGDIMDEKLHALALQTSAPQKN